MSRLFFGVYCAFASVAAAAENANVAVVRDVPGLVAFWTFQEPPGHPREAVGVGRFPLRERGGAVARVEGGLFGPHAARLEYRQWFELPRDELGPLDIHGPGAEVTVVAWVRRGAKPDGYCEAIAGVWDEERRNRQYALFVAMPVPNADGVKQQVGGHVSSIGGPTPGFTASKSRANGATPVPRDGSRRTLGFTYDGETIRAYYDGRLDALEGVNPFDYPHGVYDGGAEGSSFTVGSVGRERRPVGPGNFFVGTLDGVAVFDRALTDAEMARLAALMPEQ